MQLPYQVDLRGQVAVVTGGGGILCREMAMALAACGARVVVGSRNLEKVQAVADAIKADGGQALALSFDVTNKASLVAANAAVEAQFGPCDLLINGAGGNHPKGTTAREVMAREDLSAPADGTTRTFYDLDPAGLEYVFNLNFYGTILATQVFTRHMAERGRGNVINISSMSGFTPLTKVVAYGSAKAAVNNFTRWAAVHLSKVGVRVNAIAPGFLLTEQNRHLLTTPDGGMTPRGKTIVAHTPMGRYGRPEELLGAVLWLASDAASGFVTGAVIPLDGGFSAFSGV